MSRFRSIVFDVDSTLSAIEGIDWLAARRSPEVAREVADLTRQAMEGGMRIDELYGRRLELVRPTRDEIDALSRAYAEAEMPGARAFMTRARKEGLGVVLLSGGLREGILPFAAGLGVAPHELHAVGIRHAPDGSYAGWETKSPLATPNGKGIVLELLDLPDPVLGVGDGITDLAMQDAGATFAAFTGVVERAVVVARADLVVTTFEELSALVFA